MIPVVLGSRSNGQGSDLPDSPRSRTELRSVALNVVNGFSSIQTYPRKRSRHGDTGAPDREKMITAIQHTALVMGNCLRLMTKEDEFDMAYRIQRTTKERLLNLFRHPDQLNLYPLRSLYLPTASL